MLLLVLMATSCRPDHIYPDPETGQDDSAVEPFDWCPEATLPDLPDQWTEASIAPGGDLFHAVEAGGVLYAGSTMNGMYRSDDAGLTWYRLPAR